MFTNGYIALGVLALVFFLIIGRSKLYNIPIWTSMLIGAGLLVGLQVISIEEAFKAINLNVIIFLFGMFSIVSALDRSGMLRYVATKMLSKANNNVNSILLVFIIGLGILSAFLVNDTIALLGIPLVIHVSRQIGIRPTVLFIALAFGISIGSAMTPIGNPQNLLIAIQSGISLPFLTFVKWLIIPTLLNLFLTYFILKVYFKKELLKVPNHVNLSDKIMAMKDNNNELSLSTDAITNPYLAKISVIILLFTVAGFIVSEILQYIFHVIYFNISVIAALGAIALYALSNERRELLYNVDYSVLVFFAAMFVFTAALWTSGLIPEIMSNIPNPIPDHNTIRSNAIISVASITFSQILSNVPFVALYNNVMISNGFNADDVSQWVMLAAASTIAGNLTIFGAASNIIIIEAAESRGVKAFSYSEFLKIGSIVTVTNLAIYYVFITFLFG
ncbi:MAG TPA: SLC13 family permease [Nitrososphaeraceae archaeon]|jgi:Na+/H+ antiporter NhaD/arsenite permease-like protein